MLQVGVLRIEVLQLRLALLLHGEGQLDNYRCDRCTRSDIQDYHAGVPQYNLQGRLNSTRSDIEDLVAVAQVSMAKCHSQG